MPRVLLFDLGGVLVEFSGVRDVGPLMSEPASDSDIRARWARCAVTEAFGRGQLSPQQFGERFVSDWGLTVTPAQFLREFRSWSRGLLPGASELLAEARHRFRLAALSNANALHWDRNTSDLGITGLFEIALSSHQVGMAKPDPMFYELALDRLGVSSEAVLFFDDVADNVTAAAALGIQSFQVQGVEDVRRRLRAERLL